MTEKTMEYTLQVLMVEDSPTDALLIEYALQRGGFHPACRRVATAREMRRELEGNRWDVVICDYNLPGFGAFEALELVAELNLDLPFIIVSGTIGEETAVAAMKAGAHDYLMKENLARLVPAVARELREAGERRERRKAEERLRENEARFRLLFEDSPISLWENDYSRIKHYLDQVRRSGIDDFERYLQGHPEAVPACLQMIDVLSVNKATLKMFQAEHRAALQARLKQTFTEDSLQAFGRELIALSRGATSFATEEERRTLTGETFHVARRLQVAPGFEASLGKVVVSLVDITERKRAQDALQNALARAEDARDKIDAMLRSVASGLLVIDTEGGIVLMNRSAEQMLGVMLQDTFGEPVGQAVRAPALASHVQRFLAGDRAEEVVELELFDCAAGETRMIQTRTSTVQTRDGIRTGVVLTLIDVTREREIDRMKSAFIKTAAHELRTPLTTIMGYAELLQASERFDQAEQREFLSHILEKAEILQKIIDDLLSLSLIEYGRTMVVEKYRGDLLAEIRRSVEHYRRDCRSHRFKMVLPGGVISIEMDSSRIGQLLENLLSNAVKYSPVGSLVTVSADVRGEECIVQVQDEGIGMTAEEQALAFDRFYRADTTDTAVGGLGLGMTISKNIVEAHGGKIWIEGERGKGTTVSFSLPLRQEKPSGDNRS